MIVCLTGIGVKGTGKEHTQTIGRYGVFTVDTARKRANDMLGDMQSGVDPKAEKVKRQALSVTLREIANQYVAERRTKKGYPLRESTKADIRRHVDQNLADWADQPIASIEYENCRDRFNELSKRSPTQANQCMVYLRALCNWARERHATNKDYPLLPMNPVQRVFKLDRKNAESARTGRVPLNKIGAVWVMLKKRRVEGHTIDDRTSAALVSFLLLTGARLGESSRLVWTNVHLEGGWLLFPAEVTKNHTSLRLPISETMRDLLESIPRRKGNDHVFASRGEKREHIGDPRGTMRAVSEIAGFHLSPHDLRRTADDIAMVCKVDADQRRQLLNHLSGGGVHGKHYGNNPDPKALAGAVESMHAWIEEQARIASAVSEGENVIPMVA